MANEDGSHLSRRLHWDAERGPAGKRGVDGDGWDERVDWSADAEAAEAVRFAAVEAASERSFERRDLDRIDADALARRRQLWRDTALLLSGLVAALLVANLVLPGISGLPGPTTSPGGSGFVAGPSASAQDAAGPTQGPILDPGLGIATPTPFPLITLPPTGSSPPSTPKPIATPRPTRAPTAPPPTAPPPTLEPTPEITPIPPPSVHVSCAVLAALTVSCSVALTDVVAGSETWDMGGQGAPVTGGDGSDSITFLYDAEGTYHVVVTVTGLDGSTTSDGTDISVSAT